MVSIFLLATYDLPFGYCQDPIVAKILRARDEFAREMASGAEFRHEDHRGSQLHGVYSIRIKNGKHIAGSEVPTSFDISAAAKKVYLKPVSVSGDTFAFAVLPTSPPIYGQKGVYNLIGIAPVSSDFEDHIDLSGCDQDMPIRYVHFPWSFGGYDLEELLEQYESVTIDQPSTGKARIRLLDLRDPKLSFEKKGRVFFELELVFYEDRNWRLGESVAKVGTSYEDGKIKPNLISKRNYYSNGNEFGFGTFENGKLVKGHVYVDATTSTPTTNFELGERLRWAKTSIPDAEFTPEYYGIDPAVGIAQSPINWWLWGLLGISTALIALGVFLRKRGIA